MNDATLDILRQDLSEEHRTRLTDWLFTSTLPHWIDVTATAETQGFVEALNFNGKPVYDLNRRGRVAPRQVFTLSEAYRARLSTDKDLRQLVLKGFDYVATIQRQDDGGWSHEINRLGIPINGPLHLYDHAFVALAASSVYRSLKYQPAKDLADDAFAVIDDVFRDDAFGGWLDHDGQHPTKLANPHMHLLEASLCHYDAAPNAKSKARIELICQLFKDYMFDDQNGAVLEYFTRDWQAEDSPKSGLVEPGHCYEWAFLLGEAQRLIGLDLSHWRRRLVAFADTKGLNPHGLAHDWVNIFDDSVSETYRLWPQLEQLRTKMFHTEEVGVGQLDYLADTIWDNFLCNQRPGVWIDQIDNQFNSTVHHVPASVLYHLISALMPLRSH